jgi:hyaluronan synthase
MSTPVLSALRAFPIPDPTSSVLSVFDAIGWREWMPLGIAGIIVWTFWFCRWLLSRGYRPTVNGFRTTTSVVVPSYREDAPVLLECLATWLEQGPTEIIIVPDLEDTEVIARLREVTDPRLRVIPFRHSGKRSALGVGIRASCGEILVLTDSDTRWEPGLLEAVQMPFIDPTVGAVSTRRNVYQRWSSVWRLVADWIIDLRCHDYVPTMGRKGGVICVSGRTAAYRRGAVLPVLTHLEHEFFLGRRCIAGDDGRLTWLVLASGYTTTYQGTARALSMFPTSLRGFVKQRIRWSRNSYRTYLTALWKGWLWRAPLVSKVTVLQILLTPATMGAALGYLVFGRMEYTLKGFGLAAVWLMAGRLIRSVSHVGRRPVDLFLLPLVTLVVIFISLPIKAYALITMNKQGWLTRNADQIGGDGQSAVTLVAAPPPVPGSMPVPGAPAAFTRSEPSHV